MDEVKDKFHAAESTHWYLHDGSPLEEVEYADPKRAGQFRKPTKKDAIKLGAVPSVTGILKIRDNPGLDIWKESEAYKAGWFARDLVPQYGGGAFEEGKTILKTAQSEARELGTSFHRQVERAITGDGIETDAGVEVITLVGAYAEWHYENVTGDCIVEKSFANPLGFGGKIDMICMMDGVPTIVDWKTQKGQLTKAGKPKKMVSYPGHGEQLAAYAMGGGLPGSRLINVMIDTNPKTWINGQPRIEVIEHTKDMHTFWLKFHHLFELWKLDNFDPSF